MSKGVVDVDLSLNSKSGLVTEGTKCMSDGEGSVSRLLRSKLWQKTAPELEVDGPV